MSGPSLPGVLGGPPAGNGCTIASKVNEALDSGVKTLRPVERESRAPIVTDEDDVLDHTELFQQRIEIEPMIDESIRAPRDLVGIPHADQIGRDGAGGRRDVRHDVPPQVGRRRVAMQEHDRIAFTGVNVGHHRVQYLEALPLVGVFG